MKMGPEIGIEKLEALVKDDPAKVVLHSFRTIELYVRRTHDLDETRISQIFDKLNKKGNLPDLLLHQLKTLNRLRNDFLHHGYQPKYGDGQIAIGTLRNFYDHEWGQIESKADQKHDHEAIVCTPLQIPGTERLSWRDFEEACRRFFEEEIHTRLAEEVTVELQSGTHRFDLVSLDQSVFIECKSYTWLKSGKRPSAKWMHAQMACRYLAEVSARRRVLSFQDDIAGEKSFAKEFVRLNQSLLRNIEVWRYWKGSFERVGTEPQA